MPEVQFFLGLAIGIGAALAAGAILGGNASRRTKQYVLMALIIAAAYLLLNYMGCGGIMMNSGGKEGKLSAGSRHFTDGCVLGAAVAFILYTLRPRRK